MKYAYLTKECVLNNIRNLSQITFPVSYFV